MSIYIQQPEQSKEYYEIEKLKLESAKIKLETEILKRPWYKRLPVWQNTFATTIGLATAIFLYMNGGLVLQNKSLEYRRDKLENEVTQFNSQKGFLTGKVSLLEKENKQLVALKSQLEQTNNQFNNAINIAYDSLSGKDKFLAGVIQENGDLRFQNSTLSNQVASFNDNPRIVLFNASSGIKVGGLVNNYSQNELAVSALLTSNGTFRQVTIGNVLQTPENSPFSNYSSAIPSSLLKNSDTLNAFYWNQNSRRFSLREFTSDTIKFLHQ